MVDIKKQRYWKLINSVIKDVQDSEMEQEKKTEVFNKMCEVEDINMKLIKAAELGLDFIKNTRDDVCGKEEHIEYIEERINQAKGGK